MEIPIQVAVRICPVGLLTNALEKKDEQIPKATADGLTDNNGNVEHMQNETKDSTICNNNDEDEEELDEKDTKCCVQSIPLAAATNMAFLRPNVPGPGIAAGVIQVGPHSFPVTHALPVNCNQHQIYHQTVFPLISLFMEGFDASVVTYGQRQSGKTHTLYGKENMEPGIVQLCISEIFAHIASHPERTFAINIAWVEICGEVVRDLLGVGSINCMTIQEVFHWMQKGLATLTNSRMEMVHNLFTFSFEQQWVSKEGLIQHRLSTASFTDLCATERLFMLNSLEQPSSLPKDLGLQSLEHVVNTLTDSKYLYNANGDNIPYNQTTLTTLLKDSFGGRAQTLVIFCVSPFERDVNETLCNLQFAFKVQCVRNFVVMNTFSDDNTPLTPEGIMPELPGGLTAGLPPTVNENFGLQFAAGQWFKLVSNAEGLFAKLLQSEVLNDVEKEQVEQWLLLKQESEDCLSSSEVTRSQKPLGPIQEAEEHEETLDQEDTLESDAEETSCRQNSDIDTDTESQRPDIEEKMEQLMEKFQQKTDKLVNERYQDFVEKYPKGVMKSQESLNKRKQEKNQKKQSKQQEEELEKIDDGADDDDIDDEEDEGIQEQEDRRPSVNGGGGGGRRRSIQPGASLSSAEIAMLNRVASREQQQSTTCMTKHQGTAGADDDFLDSSSDVPTLRQNINSPCDQIQKKLRKLDTDIEAHLKQIKEVEETMNLKQNIITELIKNSDTRSTAKQRFNKKKAKLEAEFEKTKKALTKAVMQHKERTEIERLKAMLLHLEQRLTDLNSIKNIAQESGQKLKKLQQSLQDSKKLVDDLHKKLKKEKKVKESLEQELKELKEKENNNKALVKHETNLNNKDMDNKGSSSKTNLKEVQSRIAHLDHVLKEKSDNLELYGDDAEQEGLRHEIRNLRKTRDHLLEQRCILDRKLKRDNQLSHKEKRKLLECDEAIEAIDAAIEFKNELICGTKSIDTSERLQREKGEQMLMARLNKLSAEEMRTLLYKYFTKVIDLRDSSRNLEVQLLQLEREKDAWEWKERVLSNAVRQARLEGERNAVLLQRQHEMKLTLMLRHLADETSNSSNVNTSYSDQSMASSIYKAGNNPYLAMQSHLPNSTSSLSDSDFDWSSAATQHQHLHAKHQHHHHHHALPPQQQASSNIVGHTKSLKSKINDMEMLTIQDPALAKYKPLDKYKDKDRNASGGETKNKLFAKFQVLTRYATNQHDDAVNTNGSSLLGGGSKRSNKDKDALALAIPADNLKKLTQNASSTKVTRQKNKLIIQDTRKN